jgi:succinyl-CoA synthetase beta subunit
VPETDLKLRVVKAQVHVGGRGKAGGVKLAKTKDEAVEKAIRDPWVWT